MKNNKCELCHGTGRIYTDLGFGYTVQPCPNCNQAYRRKMNAITGVNEDRKSKQETGCEKRGAV